MKIHVAWHLVFVIFFLLFDASGDYHRGAEVEAWASIVMGGVTFATLWKVIFGDKQEEDVPL